MNTQDANVQEKKSQSIADGLTQMQSECESSFQSVDNKPIPIDNRPDTIAQRKIQEMANNSQQAKQAAQLQAMANSHSTSPIQRLKAEEEDLLQGKFAPIQRQEAEEDELQMKKSPIQKKTSPEPNQSENKTGLPDNLKSGVENLSGYSMDDVKVNYNSPKPAQLNAHAYAQGTDIHVSPGQEKHVPHEAWHVVQQKQGRVKPTLQMKSGIPVNDDTSLEKEADFMGAKAVNYDIETSSQKILLQKKDNNNAQAIQLKPETVKVTGITHLVKMKGKSIFEGENHETVKSGDLVTIEPAKVLKSRRGPNQEIEKNRQDDKEGEHIYTWYQAKEVNAVPLDADNIYLRDETFLHSTEEGAFELEKEELVEKQKEFNKYRNEAKLIIEEIEKLIQNCIDTNPDKEFEFYSGTESAALNKIKNMINKPAPSDSKGMDYQRGEIKGVMETMYKSFEEQAYIAKNAQEPDFGSQLINISDLAFKVAEKGDPSRNGPTGDEVANTHDKVADVTGKIDAFQTTTGGLGGGILTAPGVLAAGAAAVIGYIAGPIGILFGAIGMFLGIRAAWRGYSSEKKLKKLIPSLKQEKVKRIAEFAMEKKRKKKWGGAITAIAGAAAVAGGILGVIAISVSTLGVGAAIMGIGAALIGLGIGIGKLIHRARKRKAWKAKMAAMVTEAVKNNESGAFPDNLMSLGRIVLDAKDKKTKKTAQKNLEDGCVKMAESRRQLLALDSVRYLVSGSPGEKYEASLVMEALKLKPDEIKKVAVEKGENSAASMVARKMKSW
ncbi:MAG: DUF4157 domain-containing protein [Saprospiraceae bacterium]|nr:DUF4157 domain-containing protein [Saprospiraceae bacterium]